MSSAKLEILRQTLPYRAMDWKGPPRGWAKPPKARGTPVRISGGIGDLILGLEVAEALHRETGDVSVYTRWPEIAKGFGVYGIPYLADEGIQEQGFDFYITINSLAFFQFAKNFEGFKNPSLQARFLLHRGFISGGSWTNYIDHHPHLDNLAARDAVAAGLNRRTLPFKMLGLPDPGKFVRTRRVRQYENPWPGHEYITIHDGFDTNHGALGRATKTWSMNHWIELVEGLKRDFPGIKIVQLGGPTSREIPGVHKSLVNRIKFMDSVQWLGYSRLHVDGDSGLVHAAWVLGTQSIVLFGPTNADFFGHQENLNIKPPRCGDCWWLQPDWMSKCPVGYGEPVCMNSSAPKTVLEEVGHALHR